MQEAGHADRGEDAGDRGKRKHEPDHNTREVPRQRAVDDHEDSAVGGPLVEQPKADGTEGHEDVEVEVEGRPGRGLVLRHGRDDGDVPGGGVVGGVVTSSACGCAVGGVVVVVIGLVLVVEMVVLVLVAVLFGGVLCSLPLTLLLL